MKRVFSGLSDQGLVRTNNQDAFAIDEPEGRFFIVADGMGGHAGGQEASYTAIEVIQAYLQKAWESDLSPEELLETALHQANQAILLQQQQHPDRADMGTTVVVVIFPEPDQPWCAHVGDSRLYRLRGGELKQITEDHTWISQAVKAGHLTAEQVRFHPYRHVLAQCLGREELQQIEVQPLEVQPGDRLLLCSDGLTEELPDPEIAIHLEFLTNCEQTAAKLVEAAKDKGGRDNITVVVIGLEASGANPQA